MSSRIGRRRATIALVVIACGLVLLAGCGGGESSTTGTSASSAAETTAVTPATTPATAVGADATTTVVDGGKGAAQYEAAIPGLQQALEETPDDLPALQELAKAYYNLGRYEEAAQTYEKMLSIQDDAFVRNNYANVLRGWGKADLAVSQYQQAIETDPSLAVAYINLATEYVRQERPDDAVALLEEGIGAVADDDKEWLESYRDQLTASAE